jgi:hypothetical protein
MEALIIIFGFFITYLFLKHAPMHDIRLALYMSDLKKKDKQT